MGESLVFISGKRTPFGSFGGSLKDVNPSDLTASAGQAAIAESGLEPKEIDHIIIGNVLQSARDSIYTPRHAGLKCGIPIEKPALGINRLCGSGFQVIIDAYHQMLAGDSQVALVGGVENMSLSPYCLRQARWGQRMGHGEVCDMMTEALHDTYPNLPMALTAENLAEKYKISRQECDDFALESQHKTEATQKSGGFAEDIVPYVVRDRKGRETEIAHDEHPRPQSNIEGLNKLKPLFKKDGTVTAGNASGIVDGAGALVVTNEFYAKKRGLKPLARLLGYSVVGCDPSIMGIGPAAAIRNVLYKTGTKMEQVDLIEVNEAFAAQTLAVVKELELDRSKLNVQGGAIAIGHPLAASGSRIMIQLIHQLRRSSKRLGIGSACIGGGQGIALLVECLA